MIIKRNDFISLLPTHMVPSLMQNFVHGSQAHPHTPLHVILHFLINQCLERNFADVTCATCLLNLCFDCDALLHSTAKKKKAHARTNFKGGCCGFCYCWMLLLWLLCVVVVFLNSLFLCVVVFYVVLDVAAVVVDAFVAAAVVVVVIVEVALMLFFLGSER